MLEEDKKLAKFRELVTIINELALKGNKRGTFKCPHCGGTAHYEFFEHYDPKYTKEWTLSMGVNACCENGCFKATT